jgi:nitroreductase
MADLMDIIRERRSIRKYLDKELPEELLNRVLESIRWSPSWANTQCWEVIVVRDQGRKQKLQETFPEPNPAYRAIVDAPVVLAICAKLESAGYVRGQVTTKLGDWFMFDLGIATQTLCLVAHYLGLGTVITGTFDHDRAAELLGVPEGYELVTLIPLGYPARGSAAPKRREVIEYAHYEEF